MSAPRRLLVLAEGRSGDPHYGKTGRGVIRYRDDAGNTWTFPLTLEGLTPVQNGHNGWIDLRDAAGKTHIGRRDARGDDGVAGAVVRVARERDRVVDAWLRFVAVLVELRQLEQLLFPIHPLLPVRDHAARALRLVEEPPDVRQRVQDRQIVRIGIARVGPS